MYGIKYDKNNSINILSELDINSLKDNLFNNKELYEEFLNILNSYKMIGWGDTFSRLAGLSDLEIDNSTIASFINNYYLIMPSLRKKVEKDNYYNNETRKISLSSMLDEAEVYGSDSYKYKKLLGNVDYKLIRKNPTPNAAASTKEQRLELSVDKVKEMYKRKYITIPPLKKEIEIKDDKKIIISVGNTCDMMNLTYGERTGACMRIAGHADSLFNFCLSNENGFHVKFTDIKGNLVSRVS